MGILEELFRNNPIAFLSFLILVVVITVSVAYFLEKKKDNNEIDEFKNCKYKKKNIATMY